MREDGADLRAEADVPGQPSGLGWLPDGRMLVVSMRDRKVLRKEPGGTLVVHADLAGHATGHANDLVVDSHGRAFVGNFGFDLMADDPLRPAGLHRVDPDGYVTQVADDLWFPNGSVITPDNVLLVVETFGNRVTAFDISDDGDLSGRRPWATFGPLPVGHRLVRVVEGGTITDEIRPGSPVYACALGGAAGTTLFACAAPDFHEKARRSAREGRMLAVRVAVPGCTP